MNEKPILKAKPKNGFLPIASVILEFGVSKTICAMDIHGFYCWDKFGRYLYVNSDSHDEVILSARREVMNEISEGIIDDEIDLEYFQARQHYPNPISHSGWKLSEVPDIDQASVLWKEKYIGSTPYELPAKPDFNIKDLKKKDEWYECMIDAYKRYSDEYDTVPTKSELWNFLASGKAESWGVIYKEKDLFLDDFPLTKAKFNKRYKNYFS